MISSPPMADAVMTAYGLQGSQGGMPQGISRNPARGGVPRPMRRYESQGSAVVRPALKDTPTQSFESAPSPASSQEKVFKKKRGSFRRTFSLKSEKFMSRLSRGRSSDSKLNSLDNVADDDLFNENNEGDDSKPSSRPRGLQRVGTMPAMRLHQRRDTYESSDDSISLTRNAHDGSLWNLVKARVGIGSFNFSRTNSQGSTSSIEALSPPLPHGPGDDDQVDAVYQVLKQGAMLRASEKSEDEPDDPSPLIKQSSTEQTSLDDSKDEGSATPNHRGEADKDETEASSTTLNKQTSKGDISNEKPPKPRSSKPQKTEQSQQPVIKGEKKSELKKSKPEKGGQVVEEVCVAAEVTETQQAIPLVSEKNADKTETTETTKLVPEKSMDRVETTKATKKAPEKSVVRTETTKTTKLVPGKSVDKTETAKATKQVSEKSVDKTETAKATKQVSEKSVDKAETTQATKIRPENSVNRTTATIKLQRQSRVTSDNVYICLYTYDSSMDDGIILRPGEKIIVIDNSHKTWWRGIKLDFQDEDERKTGLFPKSFVAKLHE